MNNAYDLSIGPQPFDDSHHIQSIVDHCAAAVAAVDRQLRFNDAGKMAVRVRASVHLPHFAGGHDPQAFASSRQARRGRIVVRPAAGSSQRA